MKRVIDVKSLVIGVLATALFFTIIGAKSRNNANFDTITAKEIKIVNSEGKVVAVWGSPTEGLPEGFYLENPVYGGGALHIYNKEREEVAVLGNYKGRGILGIYNKEGKPVAILGSPEGEGALVISNKEGKTTISLGSVNGEGMLDIHNKHGKRVATVQADKNSDGAIYLSDRYGDYGWSKTGKK